MVARISAKLSDFVCEYSRNIPESHHSLIKIKRIAAIISLLLTITLGAYLPFAVT